MSHRLIKMILLSFNFQAKLQVHMFRLLPTAKCIHCLSFFNESALRLEIRLSSISQLARTASLYGAVILSSISTELVVCELPFPSMKQQGRSKKSAH